MLRQLILCWLLTLATYANHVHWMGDYDKALQLAHKENKPLVVLVVKKDSKMCNKILHQQFMNHPYIDTINDKMIAVMVTYEGKLSYPVEMYYTTVFPTLFFVDTKTETFMHKPLYGKGIEMGVLKKIILTMCTVGWVFQPTMNDSERYKYQPLTWLWWVGKPTLQKSYAKSISSSKLYQSIS